jgi:hypothetical protein
MVGKKSISMTRVREVVSASEEGGVSRQDQQQGGESWISNEDAETVQEVWYDFFPFFVANASASAHRPHETSKSILTRGLGVAMVARQGKLSLLPDSMSPIDASNGFGS